ncbi:n-acetylglutamate synthase [Fictibacillus sp. KIGAM418]|uniref:N-acetylglutamate synthase n=1 Tax=Fictibacillus marinisediminis TaxID=2878389 RepID=A0A9X1XDM3_9BACL|nr:n-acetylglutamate synthase [Fictibacillus marinisediminis]MCK6258829.1 n-acetylglutamate synthase [Fictibacillus marinisediminis]
MATYHNQVFVSVPEQDVQHERSPIYFTCIQEGLIVRATYTGDGIQCGRLVGMVDNEGELHFKYHHVNKHNELRGGVGRLVPEWLPDGRITLTGSWQGLDGLEQKKMKCHSFKGARHLNYTSV